MSDASPARNAGVGHLLGCLFSFGVAVGTYRWARSQPGELGFGGVIFLFPIFIGGLAGFYFAAKALMAWIELLTPRNRQSRPTC